MTYTVREIAERFKTSQQTVLRWVACGALKAINVAPSAYSIAPRWRITEEALKEFEESRQHTATAGVRR